jgi:hypothetical protein
VPLAGPRGDLRERRQHFKPGELPLFEMYLNSINLRIVRDNVRANIPPALDLAQGGRVEPRKVVSAVLDWETLPEELPKLHAKPVFVRQPVAVPSEAASSESAP